MSFFDWTPQLDVHIPAMNEEHRWLIGLMNKLYEQCAAGAAREQVDKSLLELGKATQKHFADEELVMARMAYPKLEVHKRAHQQLLTKLAGHVTRYRSGQELGDEFFQFLRFWLSAHIQGMDMQYADHAGARPMPRSA
jgi:hemerythrin-like metal-binding protein